MGLRGCIYPIFSSRIGQGRPPERGFRRQSGEVRAFQVTHTQAAKSKDKENKLTILFSCHRPGSVIDVEQVILFNPRKTC